jgi:ubiquinone/menaquinone biosynthesis C-methylase UbiE
MNHYEQDHSMINEDRIFRLAEQTVEITDIPATGFILDVGGGGEAVIAQLKGPQVIAIDLSPRELADAPAGALNIIMDAREMKFLDCTFNTVTAFFSFMFIHPDDRAKVLHEIFRVMTPGGRFMLWDIEIPQRPEPTRDVVVFRLQVKLPSTTVHTGYGTPFTEESSKMSDYIKLAEQTGFQVIEQTHSNATFFCIFQKPG